MPKRQQPNWTKKQQRRQSPRMQRQQQNLSLKLIGPCSGNWTTNLTRRVQMTLSESHLFFIFTLSFQPWIYLPSSLLFPLSFKMPRHVIGCMPFHFGYLSTCSFLKLFLTSLSFSSESRAQSTLRQKHHFHICREHITLPDDVATPFL